MSKRTAFWLAWFTWVLYVIIAIVTLLLQFKDDPSSWLNDMFDALILLAFATVGSLVASRRPENPIGWLFCISTLLWALGSLLQEYTTYALITVPGSLQAGALMGIIGHWIGGIGFFLMLTFGLLLFPNGHLPSPRWRFLAWLIAVLLVVYSIPGLAHCGLAGCLFDYLPALSLSLRQFCHRSSPDNRAQSNWRWARQ